MAAICTTILSSDLRVDPRSQCHELAKGGTVTIQGTAGESEVAFDSTEAIAEEFRLFAEAIEKDPIYLFW